MMNFGTKQLIRGEDFSWIIYLGTIKDIDKSTNANPSVVTVPAHGFSSATKKGIRDHLGNTAINNTASNPLHTITVVDANTFSVPIVGISDGFGGEVLTPEDLTGKTVTCHLRKDRMDTATAGASNVLFSPTVTVAVGTDGKVTISIAKALTFKDAVGGLTLDTYAGDILVNNTYYAYFDIKCVKSSSR